MEPPPEPSRRATRATWLMPIRLEEWAADRKRRDQSRPPRRGHAPRPSTARRTRGSRRTATRASPGGDDPPDDDPPPELTGRAAELAAELRAASDALVASWRAEWEQHDQLQLGEESA